VFALAFAIHELSCDFNEVARLFSDPNDRDRQAGRRQLHTGS